MRIYHAIGFILLIASFSCSIQAVESATQEDFTGETTAEHMSKPYPESTASQEDTSKINTDTWQCGFEVISVKGPDGEMIQSLVPLSCDPLADLYKGCPFDMDANHVLE